MLSGSDLTAITSGVASSDAVFYSIGGAILVVCAGFWGFRKVQSLLSGSVDDDWEDLSADDKKERDAYAYYGIDPDDFEN
jgi:hypothetical protein